MDKQTSEAMSSRPTTDISEAHPSQLPGDDELEQLEHHEALESPPASQAQVIGSQIPDQQADDEVSVEPVQSDGMDVEQLPTPFETQPSVTVEEVWETEIVETKVVTVEAVAAEAAVDAEAVATEVIETDAAEIEIDTETIIQDGQAQLTVPEPLPEEMELDSGGAQEKEITDAKTSIDNEAPLSNAIEQLLSRPDVLSTSGINAMGRAAYDEGEAQVKLDSPPDTTMLESEQTGGLAESDQGDDTAEPLDGADLPPAPEASGQTDMGDYGDLSLADENDELEIIAPEPLLEKPNHEAETSAGKLYVTETGLEDAEQIPSPSTQLLEDMAEAGIQQVSQVALEQEEHLGEEAGETIEDDEEDQPKLQSQHSRSSSITSHAPRRLRSSARVAAAESSQDVTAATAAPDEVESQSSRRGTASPPRDVVQEEITVQPKATRTRSRAFKSQPVKSQSGKPASRATSPDISLSLARQSIAAKQRKRAPEPIRTSPRSTRGRASSEQLNSHNEVDSSIQLAKAALASPTKASVASTEGDPEAKASALKMELTRRLRTELPECVSLKSLRSHLDKQLNVVGIVTMEPNPPTRAKGGPREFMLSFFITDPAAAPSTVIEVLMYRPHKDSLPAVKPGDAVLLEGFKVRSLSKKGYGLQSHSDSAWAVFDSASSEDGGSPSIKGPPVEDWQSYVDYIRQLKEWWASLDEPARQKIEKANKKMDEVNHPK
jgi:hypothetical protein